MGASGIHPPTRMEALMATSSVMVNTFGPAIVNTADFAAVSSATTITLTASGASNLAITNTAAGATVKVLLPLAEGGIEGKTYTITNLSTTAANTLTIKNSADNVTYATLPIATTRALSVDLTFGNVVTLACYYTGSVYAWVVTSVGFCPTNP